MAATDLIVLAINTRKVTSAEENVADTIFPTYNRFFSTMNIDRTDIESGIAATKTMLSM